MAIDSTTLKIIQMVVRLARKLDIPVIAEGIEEASEAGALLEMGCTFGQGYLFGRPVPIDKALDLVHGWTLRESTAPVDDPVGRDAVLV